MLLITAMIHMQSLLVLSRMSLVLPKHTTHYKAELAVHSLKILVLSLPLIPCLCVLNSICTSYILVNIKQVLIALDLGQIPTFGCGGK